MRTCVCCRHRWIHRFCIRCRCRDPKSVYSYRFITRISLWNSPISLFFSSFPFFCLLPRCIFSSLLPLFLMYAGLDIWRAWVGDLSSFPSVRMASLRPACCMHFVYASRFLLWIWVACLADRRLRAVFSGCVNPGAFDEIHRACNDIPVRLSTYVLTVKSRDSSAKHQRFCFSRLLLVAVLRGVSCNERALRRVRQ